MGRWKTVAGVLLIFVLGALTGSLGTGWMLKRQHPLFRKDSAGRVDFIMKRLSDRLDLTETQKPQVEAIVQRIEGRMRRHFTQQRAEMRRFIDEEANAIALLLTPAQQEEFEDFRKEMEARRRERHGPPPPPE
jgi:Spy/CpxP family protein refolding chaperone